MGFSRKTILLSGFSLLPFLVAPVTAGATPVDSGVSKSSIVFVKQDGFSTPVSAPEGSKVSDVLRLAGVDSDTKDFLSKPKNTVVRDFDVIEVKKVSEGVVSREVETDFATREQSDPVDCSKEEQDKGSKTVQEGVKGVDKVFLMETALNGSEPVETELGRQTVKPAVEQVTAKCKTPEPEKKPEPEKTDSKKKNNSNQQDPPKANISMSKTEILKAAGVPESEWPYADYIISHESEWRHNVYNQAGSGAYGLCQANKGNRMASAGDDWKTNPVTQMKWCDSYANSRYNGWKGAYDFWVKNHWW